MTAPRVIHQRATTNIWLLRAMIKTSIKLATRRELDNFGTDGHSKRGMPGSPKIWSARREGFRVVFLSYENCTREVLDLAHMVRRRSHGSHDYIDSDYSNQSYIRLQREGFCIWSVLHLAQTAESDWGGSPTHSFAANDGRGMITSNNCQIPRRLRSQSGNGSFSRTENFRTGMKCKEAFFSPPCKEGF